jgi:hypothetical protein
VFKHLGLRQKKNMKAGENRIMSSFLVWTTCQILLHRSNQQELYGQSMWHVWQTREMLEGDWLESLKERNHLEDLWVHENIILKWSYRNRMVGHGVHLSVLG